MPSADIDNADVVAPPKFSRYRSVRQANASKSAPNSPPQVTRQSSQHDASVTRSMSRYRRPKVTVQDGQIARPPLPEPVPPLPTHALLKAQAPIKPPVSPSLVSPTSNLIPLRTRTGDLGQLASTAQEHKVTSPSRYHAHRVADGGAQRPIQRAPTYPGMGPPIAMGGQEFHERSMQEQAAREEAKLAEIAGAENAKRLAEQKRKDLERLEAELEAAAAAAAPPSAQNQSANESKEKFGLFSRKRGATLKKGSPPPSLGHGSGNKPPTTRISNDMPKSGDPGASAQAPRNEAPVSAVNAGERRVLIRCKQSSINLPISPDTTPVDLIYSAANIMSHNINPSCAVLLESYGQLGLERRIRRYEHIRDVMNSWDRDTQNALIIENSDSPKNDLDLDASSVPAKVPPEITVHVYHSQKPGKWNKRYITLLPTGQIYLAKKSGAKPHDKDIITLCHLTDFDIYTPTPHELRKNLKPPKKFCHAIKSQQKTVMFLNTENFVHFFCTDDEDLSEKWYRAVQTWRSWYLVNKMGEGNAKMKSSTDQYGRPMTKGGPSRHIPQMSVDGNPYTIGSFKPLGIMERFNSMSDPDSEDEQRPRQVPFHMRNSVNLSKPSRQESKRRPPVSYKPPPGEEEGEFLSNGLLGRTYSQRQKELQEREAASGPFVEGPSLLNSVTSPVQASHPLPASYGEQRTLSVRSTSRPRAGSMTHRPQTNAGPARDRSMTLTGQKPLIDLTPKFEEPPQWNKAGKGRGVAIPQGVRLVDVASSRDPAFNDVQKLPTIFRRDA
ncbi:hypothetical protein F5884DRAFT_860492 [Xylogone sp. PMI_703]|nr:hypothetical protein F5884DRAFT_860492 [Xylogone sp. PMI_703]